MTTTSFQRLTINAIQARMQSAGSHWWDHSSMKFFGTKVVGSVFNGPTGAYFVTTDYTGFERTTKGFTVRKYDPAKNNIDTIGDMAQYDTRTEAARECVRLAEEGTAPGTNHVSIGNEDHMEMTPRDDLMQALSRAGVTITSTVAHELMKLSGRVQKAAVDHCNKANFNPDRMYAVASKWIKKNLGLEAVVGGDHRGATLKLVLPNGETNDIGKEGWIVPQYGDE